MGNRKHEKAAGRRSEKGGLYPFSAADWGPGFPSNDKLQGSKTRVGKKVT